MKIKTAAIVDIGQSYEKNDDRMLVGKEIYNETSGVQILECPFAVAVCDGVGGYSGGSEAAQILLDELKKMSDEQLEDIGQLEEALRRGNEMIYEMQKQNRQYRNMCTTVAGMVFGKEKILIFHAGDSRVYRFDGRFLCRMTVDHSAVQEMVNQGIMTPQDAAQHECRNLITRCMGDSQSLPPEIYESQAGVKEGDIYMVCSDGLWDGVSDKKIKEILLGDGDLMEKAESLVELAKEGGSQDNISICLCSRTDEEEGE